MYAKKITIIYTDNSKENRVIKSKKQTLIESEILEIERSEGVKMNN